MNDDHPPLDPEDFEDVDWQAVAAAEDADATDLLRLSRTYRTALEEEEDDTRVRVFEEIGHLCTLGLRPDEARRNPFIPLMQGKGFRTAQVEDLDEATIAACIRLASTAPSPSCRHGWPMSLG